MRLPAKNSSFAGAGRTSPRINSAVPIAATQRALPAIIVRLRWIIAGTITPQYRAFQRARRRSGADTIHGIACSLHAGNRALAPSGGCAKEAPMGLAIMILGLVVFLGGHVFITMRGHRAAAIARFGE